MRNSYLANSIDLYNAIEPFTKHYQDGSLADKASGNTNKINLDVNKYVLNGYTKSLNRTYLFDAFEYEKVKAPAPYDFDIKIIKPEILKVDIKDRGQLQEDIKSTLITACGKFSINRLNENINGNLRDRFNVYSKQTKNNKFLDRKELYDNFVFLKDYLYENAEIQNPILLNKQLNEQKENKDEENKKEENHEKPEEAEENQEENEPEEDVPKKPLFFVEDDLFG